MTESGASDPNAATLELVAPFMPRAMVNELCSGRSMEEWRRRKLEIDKQRYLRACWIQRQMGRENAQRETRFVNGLGQHKACIDPELYVRMERIYGLNCWHDPDFLNHTLKHTPEIRVPTPAPRHVVVNGFRDREAA